MLGDQRKAKHLFLYGDSLLIEGVRASLKSCLDLEVRVLDPSRENALEAIQALGPAILIFDLDAVGPDFQLSLLKQPCLTLVGMDSETHQALVWSGRRAATLDASDLVTVIRLLHENHNGRKGG
jgi:hypothetical protein